MFDEFSNQLQNSQDDTDVYESEDIEGLDGRQLIFEFRDRLEIFVDQLAAKKTTENLRETRKNFLIQFIQTYPREKKMFDIGIVDSSTGKRKSIREADINKINTTTITFLQRNGMRDQTYGFYINKLIELKQVGRVKYVRLNIHVVQDILSVLNKPKFNPSRRSR